MKFRIVGFYGIVYQTMKFTIVECIIGKIAKSLEF